MSADGAPLLRVAGVDEAGRGPLAGPVTCAAVILRPRARLPGLDDSKRMSASAREELFPRIQAQALAWCVVFLEVDEIDRLNIFHATMEGMRRAVLGLTPAPHRVLVDGNALPRGLPCAAEALVGGDARERAIMAASVLAKVIRDRRMVELDAQHPGYGFAAHKGYSTPEHFAALERLGPCAQHRRSFAPVQRQFELAFDFD
jgi:ribonuclease HII